MVIFLSKISPALDQAIMRVYTVTLCPLFCDAAVISILIPVAESPPVIKLNIYNNNR
jgi:hypothetical protein